MMRFHYLTTGGACAPPADIWTAGSARDHPSMARKTQAVRGRRRTTWVMSSAFGVPGLPGRGPVVPGSELCAPSCEVSAGWPKAR